MQQYIIKYAERNKQHIQSNEVLPMMKPANENFEQNKCTQTFIKTNNGLYKASRLTILSLD